MFFRKKRPQEPEKAPQARGPVPGQDPAALERISVRKAARSGKRVSRAFPGPRAADSPLRVAVERSAHAELIAHAKSSLEEEVCGVLVGQECEDDEGVFVQVEAVIQGAAASSGSTHVTFTQETWTSIHRILERDHPKRRIVGWYHTHPGFGVAFSDMDLFIQRHFFSGPTQIALVTDPLSGAVALCVNTPEGVEYLPRFWVDGRPQLCRVPDAVSSGEKAGSPTAEPGPAMKGDVQEGLQSLEARLSQLIQVVDEQQASLYRFQLFVGTVFCLGIIAVAGYAVYLQFKARVEPPRNVGFAPVPVQIGDRTALLGVQIVSWDLPPELDVVRQAIEQLKRELEKEAAGQAGTNTPLASPAAPSAIQVPPRASSKPPAAESPARPSP